MRRRLLISTVAATVLLAGRLNATASITPASAAVPIPRLHWHACPPGSPARAAGFVCATATVPLDYARPNGQAITLAVVKHPATGHRRGSLFMNPGGPGGTGTGQIPAWTGFVPAALRTGYDIVSWDPRGIGESTAVQCFATQQAESAFLGPYADFPVGPAAETAYIQRWAQFGARCAARNGSLLEHVTTAETARDLELLRWAVGDLRLNYIGLSYGTILGATYANLFPDRVGALVLDGNVAPSAWTARVNPALSISMRVGTDQAAAQTLTTFLRLCGQVGTTRCAFSAGSPGATVAKFDALLARLRQGPITLPGGKTVTYSLLLDELVDLLDVVQQSPGIQGWPGGAQALQELWQARGSPATGSRAAAAAGTTSRYNGPEQGLSVACDAPSPPPGAYPALAHSAVARGNEISASSIWGDESCSTWPAHSPARYAGPWNTRTANPILVVGNTLDPSTPYYNSLLMVQELANARLLTVDGFGHTALLNPSSCANKTISDYIIRGTLPATTTLCRQDRAPFPAR